MEIKNAKYEISSAKVSQCPDSNVPEYAFIGRSNVGKSSLINMLTKSRGLAKTSQKPGKTLLINHFRINNGEFYIVDLPGYGYAARGKAQREEFKEMIESYILYREQMVLLFLLIDIRHEPQKIDLQFLEWLGRMECRLQSSSRSPTSLDLWRRRQRWSTIRKCFSSIGRSFLRYL